jgi:hypothetical protein
MAGIPVVKSKNWQPLMREERQIVFDIFNFIKARHSDTPVSWLAAVVAAATGVSRKFPRCSLTTPKKK